MSTAMAAQAGRTADRLAILSVILNAGVVAFGLFLADGSGSDNYLLLSGFGALGVVATLLARASVRTGSRAWVGGVVVLAVAVGVLACAVPGEGGLGVLSIGILVLFSDWLVFSTARRSFT
jgi:hypothetical protein